MAPLQKELLATEGKSFLDFLFVLLDARDVGFVVPRAAVEVAELTVGDADVGRIGIAIDDPGDGVTRYVVLAQFIADVHQFTGMGIFKQKNTLFGTEKIPAQGALKQFVDMHVLYVLGIASEMDDCAPRFYK